MKYNQKQIKNMVTDGLAKDITNYDFDTMKNFLHSHTLDTIAVSSGMYGMNGCLLKDIETGDVYAITTRNSALFQAV